MIFCPECKNKLRPNEENNILYNICAKCGYKEKLTKSHISTKIYKNSLLNSNLNTYLVYDNTLPRTIHIKCPNDECESQTNPALQESVRMQNNKTLDVKYICCICLTQYSLS